ncbi:MAG: O-antigen ligase family protein [Novosphingobium sp.]
MQFADRSAARHTAFAAILLAAALGLGGGGSPAPMPEIALQCFSAVVVAVWLLTSRAAPPFVLVDRNAWIIAGLILFLPIVQLVPLPPPLWHALKGRELEQAALALVGAQDSWRPWSVLPARTVSSLLVMIPAVAMLIMASSLPRGGRAALVAVVAAMAVLSLVIGAGQMSGGFSNPLRFYSSETVYLNGFQANHNSTADVLLIGMVSFAASVREYAELRPRTGLIPAYRLGVIATITLILSFGVFLTASRMGMLLLPVAYAGVLWLVWPLLKFDRRALTMTGLTALLVLMTTTYLAINNHVIEHVLKRFDFVGEYRPQIWHDTLYAIGQYLPWGSGMGTFMPVFAAAERLEAVGATVPNRAHNDYLELLLEGGLFGAMLFAAVAVTVAAAARRALKRAPAGSKGQVVFAITTLAVIALHSQVDYPLRSMSLSFVAAICVGLLMPLPGKSEARGGNAGS